jgi:NAD(P)-dependent dehydrogenase (short-subunit alcohol dehydrogenase family)
MTFRGRFHSLRRDACCLVALCGALALLAAAAQAEPTVLITGANRGIGLEFARQFAALDWRVIATVRDPAAAADLRAIKARALTIERMDVTDQAQVDALAAKYRGQPIDVLLNNAGLLTAMDRQSLDTLDFEVFDREFAVNSLGPMRVSRAFLPNVLASQQKIILALSSAASSHGMIKMPSPLYAYRASKAALNMLMHILATDLAGRGVRVAVLNPGLVDTRGVMALKPGDPVPEEFRNAMPAIRSGQLVLITPEESVRGMMQRIRELTPEQSGSFINYDGRILPW